MVPMEGGCMCGAIRYELREPYLSAYVCHCRACQYVSGGGPAYMLTSPTDKVTITRGHPRTFWSIAEDGTRVARHFCNECGTPLFGESAKEPAIMSIKVGSLDDPTLFTPAAHQWVSEAQPWTPIDTTLHQTAKGPELAVKVRRARKVHNADNRTEAATPSNSPDAARA